MYKFKDIDSFKPGSFERVGTLKGKRWYTDYSNIDNPVTGLFKPKRFEFGDRKVFCANHYGEFVGYLLAKNSNTHSCPTELAILSKYFPHIYKEINNGTPIEKKGCIIYSLLNKEDSLEAGSIILERYPELRSKFESEDDIDLFLSAVELRTRKFYEELQESNIQDKSYLSKDYIENKVNNNRLQALDMIIYDCLYGNNDRHNENWSMVRKHNQGRTDIELYPLYDNERVLGLYENQHTIESVLKNANHSREFDNILFSRMRVPGERNRYSNYKDVLSYLIHTYPEEVTSIIERHLKANTPEKVSEFLNSCEDLPKCYIEFGNLMYQERYTYAKRLLERKRNLRYNIPEIKIGNKHNSENEFLYLGYIKRTSRDLGYTEEEVK